MKIISTRLHRILIQTTAALVTLTATLSFATTLSLPIPVFNTGVDANGNLLGNSQLDPHYSLLSAPAPFSAAYTGNGSDVIFMPWLQDGPASRWIGPTTWMGEWRPTGTYTYRTTFDLTGLEPTTALLNLSIASDNTANVYLNGIHTGIITPFEGFSSFSSYSITSGFVSGVNTLDFEVYEPGNTPSGLRVEISGVANAVPEPSSFALLALSVATLGLARRYQN